MIPGHIYLSAVVPPFEKWPFVIAGMVVAMIIGYLFVKGLLAYDKWRTATGRF